MSDKDKKTKISIGPVNINMDEALKNFQNAKKNVENKSKNSFFQNHFIKAGDEKKPEQKPFKTKINLEYKKEDVDTVEQIEAQKKPEITNQVSSEKEDVSIETPVNLPKKPNGQSFSLSYEFDANEFAKPEEKPKEKVKEKKKEVEKEEEKVSKFAHIKSKVYKKPDVEVAKVDLSKGVDKKKKVVVKKAGGEIDIFDEDFTSQHLVEDGIQDFYGNKITIKTQKTFIDSNQRKIRSGSGKFKTGSLSLKKTEIILEEGMNLREFAIVMAKPLKEITKKLREYQNNISPDSVLDVDTMQLVADELGFVVKEIRKAKTKLEKFIEYYESSKSQKELPREPIVAVMGHVDHGKTTLLDTIRKTKVAEKEAGGITQSIGSYKASIKGREITFIDTPGHAAFTKIREMGARATDVIIIIVAADDSLMPQTIESIEYARSMNAPMVVAINKIDSKGANIEKVKKDLMAQNLIPEEYGGDVQVVGISALNGTNIDELLNAVLLQADVLELKTKESKFGKGVVVEARSDKNLGNIAQVIIKEGVFNQGSVLCSGEYSGKIRILKDHTGKPVKTAHYSDPVQIIGLNGLPQTGDEIFAIDNDDYAKMLNEYYEELRASDKVQEREQLSDEAFLAMLGGSAGAKKTINIILKADAQGSLDGILHLIKDVKHPEVEIEIKHAGIGNITDSDVDKAEITKSKIIGFNVSLSSGKLSQRIDKLKLSVRYYDIIYRIIDDLQEDIKNILDPVEKEVILGSAAVRKVFNVSKIGIIAGCVVDNGKIERRGFAKVMRGDTLIHSGKIESLKEAKLEIKEQTSGRECGISIEGLEDLKEGDKIVCFIKTFE